MNNNATTVYVIDDDDAVRESLSWLLESVGLKVETYADARSFLAHITTSQTNGCVVTDVRMPGMSGLELQTELTERQIGLPVIIITGHGDVPMAVRAMKSGAYDFIEKPFNDQELLERVQRCLQQQQEQNAHTATRSFVLNKMERLTAREQEVLGMVVDGLSSRVIGDQLGISSKTVEVHRAKIMDKMGADSVASLVRMAMLASIG